MDDAKGALHTQLGLVMQQKPSQGCGVDKVADWTNAVSEILDLIAAEAVRSEKDGVHDVNIQPDNNILAIKRDPILDQKILEDMEKNVASLEEEVRIKELHLENALADTANRIANSLGPQGDGLENSGLHTFMESNVARLEKQLRSMRLRQAHAFADSANRIANSLANSDLNASSAYFEKFLRDNESSPRRLLQLALESEKGPQPWIIYSDCAAMILRIKELEEDEQDMHERDVVAKNVMYAAFAASLKMG